MTIASDIALAKGEAVQRTQLKTLTLDIETSPSLAYIWKMFKENIPLDRLIESGEVMCVAAKWYGDPNMMFFSNFHNGHEEMVYNIWDLLDQADIVNTYNGDRFDIPHLNTEFVELGLGPASPFKTIDLYKVVRSQFRFQSNKLGHVAPKLGVGEKVKHSGFDLWVKCMAGDREAWEEFRQYCEGDVIVTEDLLTRIRPWVRNHPVVSLVNDPDEIICPRCGSDKIVTGNGKIRVGLFEYPKLHCTECTGWLKGKTGVRISNVRTV